MGDHILGNFTDKESTNKSACRILKVNLEDSLRRNVLDQNLRNF